MEAWLFRTVVAHLLALAGFLVAVPAVLAHEESTNFVSELRGLRPSVDGLGVNVVGRDEAVRLTNGTGKTVFVLGYDGERYLRFLPGGEVQINVKSPTSYLNRDVAHRAIPRGVSGKARPVWRRVARDGAFVWHEHRIRWTSEKMPVEVKDETRRTRIFDWSVPMLVGRRPVQVVGTLYWDPVKAPVASASKFNITPFAIGGLLLVAGSAMLVGLLLRSRQLAGPTPSPEASSDSS
jgi:hypothetical protein